MTKAETAMKSLGKIYCVKEHKKTGNADPAKIKQIKNGNLVLYCKCASCGAPKTRFLSKKQARERVNGKGILSAIPIVGPIIDSFL